MICKYCNFENPDGEEFCLECGRTLIKKSEFLNKKKIQFEKVGREFFLYQTDSEIIPVKNLSEYLQTPLIIEEKNEKKNLLFLYEEGCSLSEFLAKKNLTYEVIVEIMEQILMILDKASEENIIIGSLDLIDFWLPEENIKKMRLRIVRPILKNKFLPEKYCAGMLSAPEVRNKDNDIISKRTDVYLAGIIFCRLLLGEKFIPNDLESQMHLAYLYDTEAVDNRFCYFHYWLGMTLDMYPTKRYRDITDCFLNFKMCEDMARIKENTNSLKVQEEALISDVGKSKGRWARENGKDEAEWNEDSIASWKNEEIGFYAYLLSDGISNCKVGSGYLASNIVKDNFESILEEKINGETLSINHEQTIKDIIRDIIEKSNREIYIEAAAIDENPTGIMGATFIFAAVYQNKMFYCSLGDSKLFLLRNLNLILLNIEDNVGEDALRRGTPYSEVKSMETKGYISKFIGGEFSEKTKNGDLVQTLYWEDGRHISSIQLNDKDLIIMTSDGVMDYLGETVSGSPWEKEKALLHEFTKKSKKEIKSLETRAMDIIRLDNKNGGGDNLSLVIIQIGED